MSRIFEALTKLEEDRQMQIEKNLQPFHGLKEPDPFDERSISLAPLFLVETLRDIKRAASAIYKIGLPSMEKSDSNEDREHARKAMTQAYDQIVSVVDMLSSYINVTSPIAKKNTIHCILEDILESNERKLDEKKIGLKKALAEQLPETILHDVQVRFILNLVLQYTILSSPPGGIIEIVTQYVAHQKEQDGSSPDPLKSRCSEVLILSSSPKYSSNESPGAAGAQEIQPPDGTSRFILHLIREMIRRNQGRIDFQIGQTKSRIRVSLRFPIERRRIAYYRLANL